MSQNKKQGRLSATNPALEKEVVPLNRDQGLIVNVEGLGELEELERRLEMQTVPLSVSDDASQAGCYQDSCDRVCEWHCADYTGCEMKCHCFNEGYCVLECIEDCLLLCHVECLGDCEFCAADW